MGRYINRLVEIKGASEGTGIIVAEGLILTAWHLLRSRTEQPLLKKVSVRLERDLDEGVPFERSLRTASVIWPSEEPGQDLDFALLSLDNPGIEGRSPTVRIPPCEWLAPDPEGEVIVHAVGYPEFGIDPIRSMRETREARGWIRLSDGARARRDGTGWLVMRIRDEDAPPQPPAIAWPGMSGAAVFVDSNIIGIVRVGSEVGSRHQLQVIPVDRLFTRQDVAEALRRFGYALPRKASLSSGAPTRSTDHNRAFLQLPMSIRPSYRRRLKDFVEHYLPSEAGNAIFGGREQIYTLLGNWLANPAAPTNLLITGPAGRGKSALLTHWLERLHPDHELVFVPISIRFGTNSASAFYSILAGRLSEICEQVFLPASADVASAYLELSFDLLDLAESRGKPVLVVIDGLDEASGWKIDRTLLGGRWQNIRFVVAARPLLGEPEQAPGESWLDRLGWVKGINAEILNLPPLSSNGVMEVARQSGLAPSDIDALLTELARLSEGDPLTLSYLIEDLRAQPSLPDASDLAKRASGFGAYFRRWIDMQLPVWSTLEGEMPTLEAILAILACALGPLRLEDIEDVLGNLSIIPNSATERWLRTLERFVLRIDGGFVLTHPRLGEHLRGQYFRSGELVRRADAALVKWCSKTADASVSAYDARNETGYVTRFYLQHLIRIGAPASEYPRFWSHKWLCAIEDREQSLVGFSTQLAAALTNAKARAVPGDPIAGWSVACELIVNSIRNASTVAPELIAACVEKGVMGLSAAIARLGLSNLEERARGLVSLLPSIEENERLSVLSDARILSQDLSNGDARVRALSAIASAMPQGDERTEIEWQLVKLVQKSGNMSTWIERMELIAPVVTDERLLALVDDTINQTRGEDRWRYINCCLPYLNQHLRDEVVELLWDEWSTPQLDRTMRPVGPPLVYLFPYLPIFLQRKLAEETVNTARLLGSDWSKADALLDICDALPEWRESLQLEILELARKADGSIHGQINCLAGVARRLGGEIGITALGEATGKAIKDLRTESGFSRLSPVAHLLSGTLLEEAFEVALGARLKAQVGALSELAPMLSADQLQRALAASGHFGDQILLALVKCAVSTFLQDPGSGAEPADFLRDIPDKYMNSIINVLLELLPPERWNRIPGVETWLQQISLKAISNLFRSRSEIALKYREISLRYIRDEWNGDFLFFDRLGAVSSYLEGEFAHWAADLFIRRMDRDGDRHWGYPATMLAKVAPALRQPLQSKVVDKLVGGFQNTSPDVRAHLLASLKPLLERDHFEKLTGQVVSAVRESGRRDGRWFAPLTHLVDEPIEMIRQAFDMEGPAEYFSRTMVFDLLLEGSDDVQALALELLGQVLSSSEDPLADIVSQPRLPAAANIMLLARLPQIAKHTTREHLLYAVMRLSEAVYISDGEAGIRAVLDGLTLIEKRFR